MGLSLPLLQSGELGGWLVLPHLAPVRRRARRQEGLSGGWTGGTSSSSPEKSHGWGWGAPKASFAENVLQAPMVAAHSLTRDGVRLLPLLPGDPLLPKDGWGPCAGQSFHSSVHLPWHSRGLRICMWADQMLSQSQELYLPPPTKVGFAPTSVSISGEPLHGDKP